MTIAEFAERVAEYCSLTGGSVTSWGRTELRNIHVGGVEFSAHRFFRAVDVVYDDDMDDSWVRVANTKAGRPVTLFRKPDVQDRIELAQRLGLVLIAEGDHDHIQPAGWQRG